MIFKCLIFLGIGVGGAEGVDSADGVEGLLEGDWGGKNLSGWASNVLGGKGLDWGSDDLFVGEWSGNSLDSDWSGNSLDSDWSGTGNNSLVDTTGNNGVDFFTDWLDFLGDATEWSDDFTDLLENWLDNGVTENVGFIFGGRFLD